MPALTVAANDTAAQGLSMPKQYDVPARDQSRPGGARRDLRAAHPQGGRQRLLGGRLVGLHSVMIEGGDGVIIVDTGDTATAAREVAAEFRKITDKPVRAVIYTCFHIDHVAGVKGFASAEDVAGGRVEIIAHDTLLANVITQGGSIAPILSMRTAYNFAAILADADTAGMNLGTAAMPRKDREVTFIAPTKTFSKTLDLTIAGIELKLMHAPSESPDEIVVFLPKSGILLSSEVIPAQCFPTLQPPRRGLS